MKKLSKANIKHLKNTITQTLNTLIFSEYNEKAVRKSLTEAVEKKLNLSPIFKLSKIGSGGLNIDITFGEYQGEYNVKLLPN